MRKFEKVKRLENDDEIRMPVRSTKNSAGYDFFAAEDVDIDNITHRTTITGSDGPIFVRHGDTQPTLVRTGIKAKMEDDDFLMLCNRSSNPNCGLILANGVGIVDSDYYGNPNNDGEIMFSFININEDTIKIHKGDKIGQGIFMKYGLTDDDKAVGERLGGWGSTGC